MQLENWKPIPGYEGCYEVSDQGRVRSLGRTIFYRDGRTKTIRERILKPNNTGKGYKNVSLWKDHKVQVKLIHALVTEAFIGPRPEGLEVCHNNGNPGDNRLENLRYDTRSANALDRTKHGNNHCRNRTHCPRGHALQQPNLVPSRAKQGHRKCLACQRAHAYLYHHKDQRNQMQQLADSYYRKIMQSTIREGSSHQCKTEN